MTNQEIKRLQESKPGRGMLRADFERTAARMRARNLHRGSGCRSVARAIEQREGRQG